jgi:hypothetical protein
MIGPLPSLGVSGAISAASIMIARAVSPLAVVSAAIAAAARRARTAVLSRTVAARRSVDVVVVTGVAPVWRRIAAPVGVVIPIPSLRGERVSMDRRTVGKAYVARAVVVSAVSGVAVVAVASAPLGG